MEHNNTNMCGLSWNVYTSLVLLGLAYYGVIFPPKFKFHIRNIIVCIRKTL